MPSKLEAARTKIDALDRRIAALLARRFALAVPLRALKKRAADPARERRVLANAAAAAGRPYAAAARAVFAGIIRQTKALQK
ncbi:MAG: chorismate mutase [Elusimicrobiales bacterium]|nr:chorismate mutase [Elusimicrobiales bacterium]